MVYLRKKVAESWYPELEEGLDAYESDEEMEEGGKDTSVSGSTGEETKQQADPISAVTNENQAKGDQETGELEGPKI